MGTIVAIGGGKETFEIDKYIASLPGKTKPTVLIIPTASEDNQGYIGLLSKIYQRNLKCKIKTLKIITKKMTEEEIREKILSADIIYVGAGDTLKMLRAWREFNIDRYLAQAHENGVILSGLSAGAVCWFQHAYSDSALHESGKYAKIAGIGLIPAMMCPHYDERAEFDEFMKSETAAVAVENNCAFIVKDGSFRIFKGIPSARAFLIKSADGNIDKQELDNEEYLPLEGLFDRG